MAVLAPRARRLPAARTAAIRSASRWRTACSTCSKRIPEYYAAMEGRASGSPTGSVRFRASAALPYAVVQQESIVDFKFRPGAAERNYDDARARRHRAYAAYYRAMLERGILLPPSQNEVMFVSTAHRERRTSTRRSPRSPTSLDVVDPCSRELRTIRRQNRRCRCRQPCGDSSASSFRSARS